MKFKTLSGREVNIAVTKYNIDWERKVSKPQKAVKDFLFPWWRQDHVLEEFMIPGSRMRIDLLNLSSRVAVEVSPDSSHKFNKFFHKDRVGGFLASVKRDLKKEEWILANDFKLISVYSTDNLDEIFLEIGIQNTQGPPSEDSD